VTMAGAQAASASFAAAPSPPAITTLAPPPPPPPVRIGALRLSTHHLRLARRADHRRHRHSRRATTARVSVTLTQAATLTVNVQAGRPGRRHGSTCSPLRRRQHASCTRFVTLAGHGTLRLKAGTSAFSLSTLLNGRRLEPGSYRLALIALDAQGNRVGPVVANFAVVA